MLAAKSFDIILGVDIHIVVIPPGAPTPIPHPFIGIVFDPMDFIPFVGATVQVNGLPRATAGTNGKNIPPHIPMGGPFTKPIGNECEIFMGSATVLADGSPMARMAMPVLSCQCIGMPSIGRKKKSSKPGMFLPTSVLMAIPMGMPVMVGGPPTIDMMAMAQKAGLSALGKLRKSKLMKKLSNAAHGAAEKAMKKLKIPPSLRNLAHKAICFVTGHPVDVATGKVFTDGIDIELPGPIPFKWERTWYSTSQYDGPLGYGWHHNYDEALCIDRDNQVVALRMCDGRSAVFPYLAPGEEYYLRKEKLTLYRNEKGWYIRDAQRLYHYYEASGGEEDVYLLTSLETSTGHAIRFTYDAGGNLQQIRDSGGRLLDVRTNPDGKITEIRTGHLAANYALVKYEYDRWGDLIAVYDALEHAMRFIYEGHLLVQETNRNGLSFYFRWDGRDHDARCIRTWGDGGIYDHKIDYQEGITVVENSLGYKTTYVLDGQGLVSQIIDANGNSSYSEYNSYLELILETDGAGLSTSFEYDDHGNLCTLILPDGATYSAQYTKDLLVMETDPNGNVWMISYDEQEQIKQKLSGKGVIVSYEYQNGMLQKIIDNSRGNYDFQYNTSGDLIWAKLPNGKIVQWRYDDMGNVVTASDPNGNILQLVYDKENNIIKAFEPDGNIRQLEYDGESNILLIKDIHREIQFRYAGLDRMISKTENNSTIHFLYDTEENMTGLRNEHGNFYRFDLDPAGFVREEIGFDGVMMRYSRDGAGKIIGVQKPDGLRTTYNYDEGGRVSSIEYNDGSREEFEYNKDGKLLMAMNEYSTVLFDRDTEGRVIKETQNGYEVHSEFNLSGRRTKISSSLDLNVSLERDIEGNVLDVHASKSHGVWHAKFNWDSFGRELERSLPGGIISKWERDRLGRPIRQYLTKGSEKLLDISFQWNINDRLQNINNLLKNAFTNYTHDSLDNLIAAQYESGLSDLRILDEVGNLFRSRDKTDRKYGKAGELLESETAIFQYNTSGNLIAKREQGREWKYEWYANGLLKNITLPDGEKTSFVYDALSRRISKTYKGFITRWIWDGNLVLHEWTENEIQGNSSEPDSGLNIDASGQLISIASYHSRLLQPVTTWLYEPDRFIPMGKLIGDTAFSIICNHTGTPVMMLDSDGTTVWQADYDIYGKVLEHSGRLSACPFRNQGQYEDEETGLYYNRFRYYDPSVGIYLSQDPIRLQSIISNFYAYVGDPLNTTDIFGLDWNYMLVDQNDNPYYHGRASDNCTPADVQARHSGTVGMDGARFDPAQGDKFVQTTPHGTPYETVRGIEQKGIEENKKLLGKGSPNVRGNKINGVNPDSKKYKGRMKKAKDYLAKKRKKTVSKLRCTGK